MTDDAGARDARTPLAMARSHGIRMRRLRLHGSDRAYDVDFRSADGSPRPLSVIAGAFSTGKTTILEFIDYCLGASDHPRHPEIMPKIRAATLEVDLSGSPYLIERAVGEPSTYAQVRPGRMDERGGAPAERRPLRPAGHPDSLSSLLLAHCKLEGVQLREALAAGAGTDPLSFRDLMWLCFLPNERLDNKNLLFENNQMRNLKLRQVFDVVFDVHDDRAVELGRQLRDLEQRLAAARTAYTVAEQLVEEQRLGGRAELEAAQRHAKSELVDTERALAELDGRARATTRFADELRERHRDAAIAARAAAADLRDRETQLQRMIPLRAQYADDVTKLAMLTEAHQLFDPLRVTACPSCLTPLAWPPTVNDGRCSMCHTELPSGKSTVDEGVDVGAELRAAKARLAEITGFVEGLERAIPDLRVAAELAQEREARAAAEIDAATAHAVTPYLAQRDALARRREDAIATLQRTSAGLRLAHSLDERARDLARQEAAIATLHEELAAAGGTRHRPERSAVVHRVSERYRDILAAWHYPKLADAYLADDLTPYVRGSRYSSASSGGRTLISLAWQLAVFEVAWETGSSHPGFLLLDSPQKNLGPTGERDAEFADTITVADIYRHLQGWLAGRGAGAQIIVADNAPPLEADLHVILRFSRRRDRPPYGLIDDETG
jgi:LSD1 subclass zinc finger protein